MQNLKCQKQSSRKFLVVVKLQNGGKPATSRCGTSKRVGVRDKEAEAGERRQKQNQPKNFMPEVDTTPNTDTSTSATDPSTTTGTGTVNWVAQAVNAN